jgi:hypothetical protein
LPEFFRKFWLERAGGPGIIDERDFFWAGRVEQAMGQQLPSWRTQKGQTLWLSMLIEAMEKFSRPEWRGRPVDRRQRLALRTRLAKPAIASAHTLRISACGTDGAA